MIRAVVGIKGKESNLVFMETPLQYYFLDASALVKRVCNEPGSGTLKKLMTDSHTKPMTSWVLIGEALGVLKRKWQCEKILDDTAYTNAVLDLLINIQLDYIHPVDLEIANGEARLKTYVVQIMDVRNRHPELDAADALQFRAIGEGMLSVHGRPTLVSADKKLLAAAEKEGIKTVSVCRD
jgi:predicted nucleic acid-binding protein